MTKRIRDYLIVIIITLISVLIFLFRDSVAKIGEFGYVGVFVLCMLSNLTVFLPAPSILIAVAYSRILSPIVVSIIAAMGATLGEMTGYIFGYSIENISKRWDRLIAAITRKVKKVYLIVFVFAIIPFPIFDFAGVYAGSKRAKFPMFFIACYMGKLIKMLFYVYIVGELFTTFLNISCMRW